MRISRRNFIKASAAAGAIAAVGCGVSGNALAPAKGEKKIGEAPGKWISTSCQGCTTWDPIQIFVQDGRAVKVRGNPNSKSNEGTCCPRAHLILQQVYDPDRVKVPMKRTNPKKGRGVDPKFVPISWDEALNTIADKMMELRNKGEAHKYMLNRGRYTHMNVLLYDAMTKIYGSPNNISHSSICAEAEKSGAFFTEGLWDYRDYDMINTKFMLIWGLDPLSSNRQVPYTIKMFGEVLDRAKVVVVDPKMNGSSAKAHDWLPVLPGEDGALAVAMAHVILTEGLWYKEYVGDFTDGANRFKKGETVAEDAFKEIQTNGLVKWWNIELKDKTPEWAEKLCGIPASKIYQTARDMAKAAPNVVVWLGPGAAMHVRGTYSAMAVHALSGLMGSSDNIGGHMAGAKILGNGLQKLDDYLDETAKKKNKKIDQRGTLKFPAMASGKPGSGVITNNLPDAIMAKDPYDIKMGLGYMNNFPFSGTGAQRWEKMFTENEIFYVHLTTHASELTMFADIVLPATQSAAEKWAYLKNKGGQFSYSTILQPVIKPVWDCKDDETEIPYLLAKKFAERGFTKLLEFYTNEFRDVETGKLPENEKEFAVNAVKYYTQPAWANTDPAQGDVIGSWEKFKEVGVWNSAPYKFKGRWGKYKTATQKFEFYSETLKKALNEHAANNKVDVDKVLEACNYEARGEKAFVPHYESPFRYGSREEYPFTFIDHKSRLNREGRSANCTWYMEFKKVDAGDASWEDVLKMNPADAQKLGIADGGTAKISSVSGTFLTKVRYWEGIRPGTVAKAYGQGHWAYGKVASKKFGKEAYTFNNNELIPADYDRLTGATARNGGLCGVKIEKA